MPGRLRIALLVHEREARFDPARYLLHHLAEFWREDGHDVFYLHGPDRFVPADLVFVHVDLSVVPDRYLELATRYPVAVNGRIRDVRKATTSRILVRPGDGWAGPVIVKSNLNYGGAPERVLEPDWVERWAPRLRGLRRRAAATLGMDEISGWEDYRIFEHLEDVPRRWFGRREVVVERFVPELENGLYHYWMYQFLGSRARCSRVGSPEPVFKSDERTTIETGDAHPEALAWRQELEIDYGKIDYVVHEGTPLLLDVNKTTGASTTDLETLAAERRDQAQGLYDYLV